MSASLLVPLWCLVFAADPGLQDVRSLAADLQAADGRVRYAAALALVRLGPDAAEAAPELASRLADPSLRPPAALALEQIGRPGVRWLRQALHAEDAVARQTAARILGRIGRAARAAADDLIAVAREPEGRGKDGVRVIALESLAAVGFPSTAVPPLVELLGEDDTPVRIAARVALEAHGPAAVPAMAAVLGKVKQSLAAAAGLLRMGEPGRAALLAALRDEDGPARSYVASALGEGGLTPDQLNPFAPDLGRLIRDDRDPEVRTRAATALRNCSPSAANRRVLESALRDDSPNVRLAAARSLRVLDPNGLAGARRIAGHLTHADKAVREEAALLLFELDPEGTVALPALAAVLRDRRSDLHGVVIRTLQNYGSRATCVRRDILRVIQEGADGDALDAARLLQSLGPRARDLLPELIALLDRAKPGVAARVAWGLAGLDPTGEASWPLLKSGAESPDLARRRSALEAMSLLDAAPTGAARAFVTALADTGKNGHSEQAASALFGMGKAAVPALTDGLGDAATRLQAVDVLGQIGRPAGTALQALRDIRSEATGMLAVAAALAAVRVGGTPADSLPTLVRGLTDADPKVRATAGFALREIGPAAKAAVPALIEAMKDTDPVARREAALALLAVGPPPGIEAEPFRVFLHEDVSLRGYAQLREGGIRLTSPMLQAAATALREDDPVRSVALAWIHGHAGSPRLDPNDLKEAVPSLRQLLAIPETRPEAADLLGVLGPVAADAEPDLLALLHAPEEGVRRMGLVALLKSSPSPRAVEAVARRLRDSSPDARLLAAKILGSYGTKARAAGPALRRLLDDTSAAVRLEAARALCKTSGETPVAVLTDFLNPYYEERDGDRAWRVSGLASQALAVLEEMGPRAAATATAVCTHESRLVDPDARAFAVRTLGRITSGQPCTPPAVLAALSSPSPHARRHAVQAAAARGPADPRTWGRLRALAADPESTVRVAAAVALHEGGESTEATVPVLAALVRESNQSLRAEAARALGVIGPAARSAVPLLLSVCAEREANVTGAPRATRPDFSKIVVARRCELSLSLELAEWPSIEDPRHAAAEALKRIDPEAFARAGIRVEPRPRPQMLTRGGWVW